MAQKPGGFTAGRGLLSAAQTLNFTSGHPGGGMASGPSSGRGPEQMGRTQVNSAEHLSSTSMKLFSSLGLSPSDLDALAQIPEDQISVETLPHILRQLKNSKNRKNFSEWEPRAREEPRDQQYTFRQDSAQSHDFGRNFGRSGDFSQLSRHDFGMATPSDSAVYIQGHMGQPSQGHVEDFLGMNPARFPHLCLLCDFDVHSIMEWNQHINGLRHAENRRVLLDMYPDWEPPMASNRSGGMDASNPSDGILGPAPMSAQTSGMSSGWGGGAGLPEKNAQGQNMRVRVVVVKYDRKPLSDKSLFNFVEPFGRIRAHLLLKNKGFLEMSTHDEALDVVNYYQQNPATLGGRPLVFSLSKRFFIEQPQSSLLPPKPLERSMNRRVRDEASAVSQVVYFSNLPREEEKKKDLLTIAGRFGTVEKHLFLSKEGFIQLSSPREADMMEKYYSMNPLEVRGHQVRCNVCTKYKTLNVPQQGNFKSPGSQVSRGARRDRSLSPRRFTDRRSPSPNPRSRERRREERPKSRPEPKTEPKPAPKAESKLESKPSPAKEENTKKDELQVDKQEQDEEGETKQKKAFDGDGCSEDKLEEEGGAGEEEKVKSDEAKDCIMADTEENVEEDQHEDEEDLDFLGNMDDMVVVDELQEDDGADAIDNSEKGGMRVVLIMGFKKGYKHLNELMQLAQPFGKVVRHLVLDMQHKAYLQFSTEEEAVAMAKFYNGNVQAMVCGRPVKIWHYTSQPTIQFGFVVYIGKLPDVKYTKGEVLKLVEDFGNVRKYFLHYIRRECFIEMETEEQAERVVEHYRLHPAVFYGQRLTIYVSRKYRVLRGRHVEIMGSEKKTSKREKDPAPKRRSNEEPPAKRSKEERMEKGGDEGRTEETYKEGGDEERTEETSKEGGDEERTEETSKEGGDEEMKDEASYQGDGSKEESSVEEGTEDRKEEGNESTEERPMEEESEEGEEKMEKQSKQRNWETSIKDDIEEKRDEKNMPGEGEDEDDRLQQNTEEERLDQDSDQDQSNEEGLETNQDARQTETPPSGSKSMASLPLPPYDPDTPLGVEHVKSGFYCRMCFLFYSNEETAKRTHCSSREHYDQLQKYLEKKKTASK